MRKLRKGESYALLPTIDSALNIIKRSPLRSAHRDGVAEESSERLPRHSVPRNDDDNGRNVLSTGTSLSSHCAHRDDVAEEPYERLPRHSVPRNDGPVGRDMQVKENLLSIRQQTHTSFVPYITSVSKQCLLPMAHVFKFLTLIIVFSCVLFSDAQAQSGRTLGGVVRSAADGQTIEGVSVQAGNKYTLTDKEGRFTITVADAKGVLKIYHIGYTAQTVAYDETTTYVDITLQPSENQIEEVDVVSTGYQRIPKERATGSFEFVDSALFNRKVSTDFVSRLEDVVPSISSNKSFASNRGKLLNINVRGVSTINSERWPLVVVDGVPYPNNFDQLNGYFNNINPNDIENVTVLKDAAASSIWGAQSGNGVIIVTTKRGKYNQPFQLSVNSNVTIAQKPDLYYYPQMASSDYIDLESELFSKGYWNSRMNRYSVGLTPVIQLLKQQRQGSLTEDEANLELDRLRGVDAREDYLAYIYRPAVNQQYSAQLRGGGEKVNTSFALGYDNNREDLVTSSYSRMTLRNNTQLRPVENLTIDVGISYTESRRKDSHIYMGYNMMTRNFPYLQMADDYGNPLVVDAVARNPTFRDTVAGGRLLDWQYRPLTELDQTHALTTVRETFMNTQAAYQIGPSLKVSAMYAYQRATQPTENWQGMGAFVQRERINYHASWNANEVIWNIPVGDYREVLHRYNNTQQGRAQLDFHKKWNDLHEWSAIAGAEIRHIQSEMNSSVYFGYDPEAMTFKPVQYGARVPALNGIAGTATLIDYAQAEKYTNRYTSYFANASYTYTNRYVASGSFRKDASNLFGVRSNDRGQPFWSVGAAWILSNEGFAEQGYFSLLKLRATYGYNGNVNNSTAAYPIINVSSSPHYTTGNPYATMQSPPNPSLRWERVGMFNLGLDFATVNQRFSGAIEYYVKKPKDLIASTQIDPTTGFSSLNINSADLDGRGVDVSLQTVNWRTKDFRWISNLVFAYNRTKVLKSYVSDDRGLNFVAGPYNTLALTPIEGMDLYSLLAFPWAGLDAETGMPRGYYQGEVSTDYAAIVNDSRVSELENHGTLMPVYFGSFRNSFSYRSLECSFNIAFQLGHKFLRESFNNQFFIDSGIGHADYARRWQNPGDENSTDVPVFRYPNDYYASQLYYYSSALVEPASQIKLRDVQLSYNLGALGKRGIKNAKVYAYLQNLGTVWRASKLGIDPEFGGTAPDPFAVSIGMNINL
ncbi:SusC/RagA family TonB-linked outer membrane protein [Sphingobacterium olei]|uniref:SusC/RagA family TonB-linked outer membrane protein n=1 Tax=Sphingobacterium olei TaxID=2571155 RepID=A0A4U0N7R4_9SPHI|nr:SusC/RagA family TonB-linked outer membrane protein [Sphingobacterium olei]TJZ49867.1 SusC/RagA family TonB-linked outer membrane protein [Sphingobacterium olei]